MIVNKWFSKGLICSLSLMFAPIGASAETVFMLQLGSFDSEKKASAHWQNLAKSFPELFEELNYSPNEIVMQPENFVSYRTQAGPVPTREAADAICAELVRSGYECGVSETAMFYGDSKEIEQSATTNPPAPIKAPVAVPVAAAPTINSGNSQIPPYQPSAPIASQFATNNNVAPPSPPSPATIQPFADEVVAVSAAPVQGTIAAAEAIPVPLSNFEPKANPYLERGNSLMNARPSNNSRASSFWADISSFSNETAAAQYVRVLKSRDPLLPPNLRVRITRPYGAVSGHERLSLRMGPFVTTRPILRLCSMTRVDNVRCRAVKDLGGSVQNIDRYSARRANYSNYRSNNRGSMLNQSQTLGTQYNRVSAQPTRAVGGNGAYYVQLGSFLSPDAANAKWKELVARHGYIMNNVANDVGLPRQGSSSSRLFRLRAGPFADSGSAYSFCNQLKNAGTICIVVR